MTVRGRRNPMPTKGAAATNIFSSHGKQKKDPPPNVPSKALSVMKYSLQKHNDHAADLAGSVNKNLRHQKPART